MKASPFVTAKFASLLALAVALTLCSPCISAQTITQISSSGNTQPVAAPAGVSGIQNPEIDSGLAGSDSDDDDLGIDLQGNVSGPTRLNRSIAPGPARDNRSTERRKPSPIRR